MGKPIRGGFVVSLLVALLLITGNSSVAQNSAPKKITLEGQFVCSQCWSEADRATTPYGTAADMKCAEECAERQVPPALAVKEGEDYKLFVIEEGKFKRPGENWLTYIGKVVKIEGRLGSQKDNQHILLDNLTVVSDGPLSSINAVGTDPELILKDLFGVDQKLSSYRGKIVVLNFWATWCIPCRKEMPDLSAVQSEYAALGVQVVGAAADPLNDRQKVLAFIRENRINFPVLLGATTEDMKPFGLGPGLPGTVVIGRDGKILSSTPSVITLAELRKTIEGLLAIDARSVPREIAASSRDHEDSSLVPS